MNYFAIYSDKEWTPYENSKEPKANTIYQFIGKQYDIDKQRHMFVFKKIGEPVKEAPITEIRIG